MGKDVIAAEAGMLILRPVADVFQALVDPEVTTQILVHAKQRQARSR